MRSRKPSRTLPRTYYTNNDAFSGSAHMFSKELTDMCVEILGHDTLGMLMANLKNNSDLAVAHTGAHLLNHIDYHSIRMAQIEIVQLHVQTKMNEVLAENEDPVDPMFDRAGQLLVRWLIEIIDTGYVGDMRVLTFIHTLHQPELLADDGTRQSFKLHAQLNQFFHGHERIRLQ